MMSSLLVVSLKLVQSWGILLSIKGKVDNMTKVKGLGSAYTVTLSRMEA